MPYGHGRLMQSRALLCRVAANAARGRRSDQVTLPMWPTARIAVLKKGVGTDFRTGKPFCHAVCAAKSLCNE